MDEFKSYIDSILKGANIDGKDKKELEDEIKDHLQLLKKEYLVKGYSEEDARDLSVKAFGESNRLKSDFQKILSFHNKMNTVNILLIILGAIPLVLMTLGNNGYYYLDYIFGEKFLSSIRRFDELILLIGIFLVVTSIFYRFTNKVIFKLLTICDIISLTVIYTTELYPRLRFVMLLVLVNVLSFILLYMFSKNIKISCVPAIFSTCALILYISANEFNVIIYHGFNVPSNIENFPSAIIRIVFVCLMPTILLATTIKTFSKRYKERLSE